MIYSIRNSVLFDIQVPVVLHNLFKRIQLITKYFLSLCSVGSGVENWYTPTFYRRAFSKESMLSKEAEDHNYCYF